MKTKNTAIGLATVILILAGGLPSTAVADKVVNVDLRFAGSFATGIVHLDQDLMSPPGSTVVSALIHANAVGSPGRAEIRGFGGRDMPPGDPEFRSCLGSEPSLFLEITIVENPLVFTFKDLSLLFARGNVGTICIDLFDGGKNKFVIEIDFIGGRGRFEGATGHAVITGEAEPVSLDGSFLGETGTIVGWINVPGD
ncbi:MAG: hypothetical protein O6946_10205 [Gammaproteobacteria bacterium]|nr:hypothetical protein [Gammaproteobacteria bacterium]